MLATELLGEGPIGDTVVAVTLDVDGRELGQQWFLAPEDGAWRLVWVTRLPTPRGVVREFYRRADHAESRSDFADDVASLVHPVSDLTGVVRQPMVGRELFTSARDARITATTVADRDLRADRIVDEFTGAADTTPAEFRDRTTDNAVVEASIRLDGEDATQEWAVATDGSAWRLVGF